MRLMASRARPARGEAPSLVRVLVRVALSSATAYDATAGATWMRAAVAVMAARSRALQTGLREARGSRPLGAMSMRASVC